MNSHNRQSIKALYEWPLFKLVHHAYEVHQKNFPSNEIELCVLLSIKTGGCTENCGYCAQRQRTKPYDSVKRLNVNRVIEEAQSAKKKGAIRFCMSASGTGPLEHEFPTLLKIVSEVKKLGIETCMTLGSLSKTEALALKAAGLDVYNHNLDTSAQYYSKIITSRSYQDRLDTLKNVSQAGIQVCCGGILGMGESRDDRIDFLWQLLQLPTPPHKIPINRLIPIPNTPLEDAESIDSFEFIKTIALTRVLFPKSIIRLAAGRHTMSDEMQAFCFMAGANSIFYGDKLLTTRNSNEYKDLALLQKLDIRVKKYDKQATQ
jgi:biotin synthase